jgi:hypothetical protein
MLLRRISSQNGPAVVFFIGNKLIFLVVSANTGQPHRSIRFLRGPGDLSRCSATSLFHSIVAFAYQTGLDAPARVFSDTKYWAGYVPLIFAAIIYITGDILMVSFLLLLLRSLIVITLLLLYRCFLIWGRNYWVIVVPVILAAISAGKPFTI